MSSILIIKHGSLGDIAQACGAIQDISENHSNDEIYLLTTKPYVDLFKKNVNIKEVILDKRLSRFNIFYLYSLMKTIRKYKFSKVYDLQNSKRTSFYKSILFPKADLNTWSSSETTLPSNSSKDEFDKKPVLDRFDHQLKTSGINTNHTMSPDFSWSCTDISKIKSEYKLEKYIILFPFASSHLTSKRWPYYNDLINKITEKYNDTFKTYFLDIFLFKTLVSYPLDFHFLTCLLTSLTLGILNLFSITLVSYPLDFQIFN